MLIGTSRALAQQALAACARRPGGVAAAALDSALGRQAWLSSAAQVEEASFRHAPVPPGSRLRLLLPGTAADIEVAVGEHEAVDIALAGPGAGSLSFHCSTALDGSAAIGAAGRRRRQRVEREAIAASLGEWCSRLWGHSTPSVSPAAAPPCPGAQS